VEGGVELLAFVLVCVHAELVMVGGGVLPLAEGLHTEELHESADFNFRELFTQLFATEEVSIFLNRACNVILCRCLVLSVLFSRSREVIVVFFRVFIFPVIILTFSIALIITTGLFAVVSIIVFVFLVTVEGGVSLFFFISELVINKTLPSRRSTVVSFVLRSCETSSHVALRSLFIENFHKSSCVVNGQSTAEFVPSYEFLFIVSHVNGSEKSIHQVLEVSISAMLMVILEATELVQVHELDAVSVHANVVQKSAHVAMGGFVQVGHHTVLHLRVVDGGLESSNFLISLVTEDVLVAEHVLHLTLVDGHAAGVGEVHSAALVAVSVLDGVVFFFRDRGEALEL